MYNFPPRFYCFFWKGVEGVEGVGISWYVVRVSRRKTLRFENFENPGYKKFGPPQAKNFEDL